MLVFDSASLPLRERHGAIVEAITSATTADLMLSERPDRDLRLSLTSWDLGGVEVVDAECTAHTLRRTTLLDVEPVLAFTTGRTGHGVHVHQDRETVVRPATLWATDLAAPYDHRVSDTTTTTAKIPLSLLGLPHDLARPVLEHVGRSPLAGLFVRHLADVRTVAPRVSGPSSLALGTATLALARAVLASVATDDRLGRETVEDVLLLRVRAFVADHLDDPDLDPVTIAAAHHVSVRRLYQACSGAGLSLEQWIIRQRLERAREDLVRHPPGTVSMTLLARRWGFATPSHFARRFREEYGAPPRTWQTEHHGRARPDQDPAD